MVNIDNMDFRFRFENIQNGVRKLVDVLRNKVLLV